MALPSMLSILATRACSFYVASRPTWVGDYMHRIPSILYTLPLPGGRSKSSSVDKVQPGFTPWYWNKGPFIAVLHSGAPISLVNLSQDHANAYTTGFPASLTL